MRKIREVLRLASLGLSQVQIHRATGLARSTVGEHVRRAERAGLSWPLPDGLGDEQIERLLFGQRPVAADGRAPLDWARIKRELAHKGVTLQLLHTEYAREVGDDAYSYSRFCELFRRFEKTSSPSMPQRHVAGQKLFVDWAGMTVPIIDRATGEVIDAQIFVATMGASNFTFVRAYRSQSQRNWLSAHADVFEALGAVPKIVVPDNTLTAITKPHRYDPDVNIAYADLARHYDIAVVPARVRKPKDKPKVEGAVLIVERDVLAPLRKQTFFGVGELNAAMQPLIAALNTRVMKSYDATRVELYERVDRPEMRELPRARYEHAEWSKARVAINYHVTVAKHHYSVPFQLIGEQLDVRQTARTIEIFNGAKRVAAHPRSHVKGAYTTRPADMPSSHRKHAEWTPERLARWAGASGPATRRVVEQILADKPHPEQSFNSVLGVMRLGKTYSDERLEAACERALRVGAVRYQSLKTMLERGLDRQPLPEPERVIAMPQHPNIRGGDYFRCAGQMSLTPTNHEGHNAC